MQVKKFGGRADRQWGLIRYARESGRERLLSFFVGFAVSGGKAYIMRVMGRKILITSGKGGVGKTTVTVNLGAALAALGLRVALVDLDLGLNNLDTVMGISNKVVYDIIDCISGRCRIKQALLQDAEYSSLYVLPSCHNYDKSCVTGQNIKIVVEKLSALFDYVLLDSPAGIENGFHRAASVADEAFIVVTPHVSSVKDAAKAAEILSNYELTSLKLIINRVRGDLILNGDMLDLPTISGELDIPPLGVIPDDDSVSVQSLSGGVVPPASPAGRAYTLLADNVHNGRERIYDYKSFYSGFFGRIRRAVKKKI